MVLGEITENAFINSWAWRLIDNATTADFEDEDKPLKRMSTTPFVARCSR